MKPTLYVMAAGMGSRYGGLKQMDGLGPNGETIIDYSIYDAIRAGFGKVVFVIRKAFEADFREIVISKFEHKIPVEVVFQEVDKLPEGFTVNPERVKPWGTNHAILMGKDVVKEPFAVINGDDFYGKESFDVLCKALQQMDGKKGEYCMVGFPVRNTLSESGSVSRGVCEKDENNNLVSVVEHTKIEEQNGRIVNLNDLGQEDVVLNPSTPVSMNMWGFTPDYFEFSESYFKEFLKENEKTLKSEFYIPTMVDFLIKNKIAQVKVLDTPSKWFGVTYADDKATVLMKLNELITKKIYPAKLWN
ncbi:MAG: nucleotidyltransferase [Paludibacteraceae bacterium]|nr:nucleotidyltransferase [Paludibacteraceae bacterium]